MIKAVRAWPRLALIASRCSYSDKAGARHHAALAFRPHHRQSVHLLFCGRPTDGKRRFRVLTLIGCCHLSGLFAQLSLLACMGVRGSDPNQTDVLEAREQILVLPIPSYRLLRHTLLRPIAVLPTTSSGERYLP